MRIGVDATCWSNRRGYGRFTRALLHAALQIDRGNHYVFFVDDNAGAFPLPEGVEVNRFAADVPTVEAASANGHRSVGSLWAASRAMSQAKVDLLFFPSVYSYVPLTCTAPKLVTIHDVIPELYPELVFPTVRGRLFWRAKVKLACAQADLVLTVSDYSRRCLSRHLKMAPERLRVVPEASDPAFRPLEQPDGAALLSRWGLAGKTRFLVYVGGFSPHKNLSMLLDIFRELQAQPRFQNLHLLLVGDYEKDVFHSCYPQLAAQARRANLGSRVIFTGYLGDPHLVLLLNLAELLVLPSFCEGFGLPAVEAAACGLPVVATSESPLVELLGGGALGVAPNDRAGCLAAITRVLVDAECREAMRVAGRAAAEQLSWQSSARQLVSIFQEAFQRRAPTA
jgi:glycosyltransferase involved in cell wall biosynthesis